MADKPKIMITFREGGENGGPFNSHKRIIESMLNFKYDFIPLIIPSGRIGIFNAKILINLVSQINEHQPDIIHFQGLQLEGFHVALAAKIAGVKNTVLAIHGSSIEAVYFQKWKIIIVGILEILTLKMSKISYGVSEYVSKWNRVKRYSKNHYGVIYNISQLENININESFRDEIGVNEDKIIIVSTGRITKEKGYEILLMAIKEMDIPENVLFVIVGHGEYLDTFNTEIKKNKLEKKVVTLGYRKDVARILKESNIFVICTLHETLCNSIIEAGYYSLPSVATNVGGIPEIITHGYNGYLTKKDSPLEVKNYLNELINDAERRQLLGANARIRIDEKFSIQVIISRIDELYRSAQSESDKKEIRIKNA